MGDEIPVLAHHLGKHHAVIFTDAVIDQGVVVHLLGRAGPSQKPALIAGRHGIGVLGAEIAGGVERPVGDRHLRGVPAAGHRAVHLHCIGDPDAGTSRKGAGARGASAQDHRYLCMLAFAMDEFRVQFAIGDHLRKLHHDRRIGADRVRADHFHFGRLCTLRGCAATCHHLFFRHSIVPPLRKVSPTEPLHPESRARAPR